MDELIGAFSVDGMSKSPAIFDVNKLTWMNAEYIRRMTPEAFTAQAMPYYEKAGIDTSRTDVLCRILQPRVETFAQIPEIVDFLAKDIFVNPYFQLFSCGGRLAFPSGGKPASRPCPS